MKKVKLILSITVFSLFMAPHAEARSLENILKECGLGAAIFKHTPAAAAISNIIWDLGTTATLSDLTTPENCPKKNLEVAMLIGTSYDSLETEIAEGRGKYINTLSKLSGKKTSTIRTEFSKVITTKKYPTMTKLEKAEKLFDIVSQ